MYIIIALGVFAVIALVVAIDLAKRRHRKRRYPAQPDGVRTCVSCGNVLSAGATDCSRCGSDSVVIVV